MNPQVRACSCGAPFVEGATFCGGCGAGLARLPSETGQAYPVGGVLGSYRLLQLIGEGGMGRVFVAEHVRLGRKVALKVLRSEFSGNLEAVKRFFAEARSVNCISHENIIEVSDFIENPSGPSFYIMELLQGMDLRALQDREGILTLPRTLRIALQVCSALGAAHQAGIIHRDLKPDNIFLIERGGRRDFVKLLDFGVAKLMNATLDEASTFRSSAGMVVGTPNYMAPEQALGHKVNHLADVYAMGVILFEMVAGRRPFVADTAREVMVQHLTAPPPRPSRLNPAGAIPEPLEALILACLRKEPEDRPQSIGEVEQRLREILRRLPAGGSGNPMRGLRAHRRAGLAVGATLLLALAVGGGLAWLRGGGSAWRGGRRVVSAARPVPRSPRPMPALAAPAAAGAPVPTATAAAPAVESPAPAPPPDPPASPRVEAARRPGRSVAPATERASAAVPVAGAGGRRRATKLDRSAVLNPFE